MPSINDELKKAGLKITNPRIKVLQLLEDNPTERRHLSADDIYKYFLSIDEEMSLATIYRVLTQFEQVGIVERHNFEGGHSVFELCADDHHDHMVCVETGKVIEFYDEVIEKRQKEIAAEHGWEITDHSLIIYGVSPQGKSK